MAIPLETWPWSSAGWENRWVSQSGVDENRGKAVWTDWVHDAPRDGGADDSVGGAQVNVCILSVFMEFSKVAEQVSRAQVNVIFMTLKSTVQNFAIDTLLLEVTQSLMLMREQNNTRNTYT